MEEGYRRRKIGEGRIHRQNVEVKNADGKKNVDGQNVGRKKRQMGHNCVRREGSEPAGCQREWKKYNNICSLPLWRVHGIKRTYLAPRIHGLFIT